MLTKITIDFENKKCLAHFKDGTEKIIGGLFLEVCGQGEEFTYKRGGDKKAERRKATKKLVEKYGTETVL